jgi:undecaprenyl-diphosphatase
MNFIYAIILGIVQGLTEFLPVSSSGHLAVVGSFLDVDQPGILFETLLHAGTVFAVVWYLRDRIIRITTKEIGLVLFGSIPAGLVGLLLASQIEGLFSMLKLVGVAFLVTAFLNYQTDKSSGKREQLDIYDALAIGVLQAIAIIPGISRSGSTIFAGSRMNLTKTAAAEFSFLLSIPAIIGANLYEFLKYSGGGDFSLSLGAVGFVAAFASGLFAINFLITMLTERNLKVFSIYLVVVGIMTILFI